MGSFEMRESRRLTASPWSTYLGPLRPTVLSTGYSVPGYLLDEELLIGGQ